MNECIWDCREEEAVGDWAGGGLCNELRVEAKWSSDLGSF